MTATLPAPVRPAGSEADFLALICADAELLRAEFEEIIAAGWESGPPSRPTPDRAHHRGPAPARHRGRTGAGRIRRTPTGAGCDEQARQRSPPPRRLSRPPPPLC